MKKLISQVLFLFLLGFTCPSQAQVQYNGCSATGNNASAIGKQNTASGNNSLAGGYTTQATGSNSLAFGYNSKATQSTTTAIGNTAIASGIGSMALGNYVKANAQNSFVFGAGTTASYPLTNNTANSIALGVNSNTPTLLITKALNNNYTGKVAIGAVANPQAKLHLKSDSNEDAGVMIEPTDKNSHKAFIKLFDGAHMITADNGGLSFSAPKAMSLKSANITFSGKVGINTINEVNDYALAVDGGIISSKVFIKEVKQWPDHVFASDYPLMGLKDLKQYLSDHRHLPGMPSEKEMLSKGYDLNEMQATLLQKIEELTLYMLMLQDEICELRQKQDSIVFAYDSNGNRVSRNLAFERILPPNAPNATTALAAYTLFPNPTSGEFTVQQTLPTESATHAVLLNMTGTILEERKMVGQAMIFDLSNHSDGIYLLEIDGPSGHETWKIIKK